MEKGEIPVKQGDTPTLSPCISHPRKKADLSWVEKNVGRGKMSETMSEQNMPGRYVKLLYPARWLRGNRENHSHRPPEAKQYRCRTVARTFCRVSPDGSCQMPVESLVSAEMIFLT